MSENIEQLLASLPRPIAFNAPRMQQLAVPAVTVKLDGSRALLVAGERGLHAYNLLGTVTQLDEHPRAQLSAFDCELVEGHFYIFDVLFAEGLDVRHLPLRARIRAVRTLPGNSSLKRYYFGTRTELGKTVARLVANPPRLNGGARMACLEGFIFVCMTAPFNSAPLKFKFTITTDFLVTGSVPGLLQLHVQTADRIVPFQARAPLTNVVPVTEQLPRRISEADAVIIECALVVNSWQFVRWRKDRSRPNTARTAVENIKLSGRNYDLRLLTDTLQEEPPDTIRTISSAMLRAVGASAAVMADAEAQALFMPSLDAIKTELSRVRAVGIVAPVLKLAGQPRNALLLEQLLAFARQGKHECRVLRGLRSSDFLSGDARHSVLDNSHFVLLRHVPADAARGTSFAPGDGGATQ